MYQSHVGSFNGHGKTNHDNLYAENRKSQNLSGTVTSKRKKLRASVANPLDLGFNQPQILWRKHGVNLRKSIFF